MKYANIFAIISSISILFLVAVGVYSYFFRNFQNKSVVTDTPRPISAATEPSKATLVKDSIDNTVASLTLQNKNVVIEGRYQSVDKKENDIDGVLYSYVLGVIENNNKNSLTKIWLTEAQYQSIEVVVRVGSLDQNKPIKIILSSPSTILIENAY